MASLFFLHQDLGSYNQSISRVAFLSGGSAGKESTFKITQIVDRIHFLPAIGLRALEFFADC